MLRVQRCVFFAFVTIAGVSASAQAQWAVTPYLGINLAGDAEFRRGGPGASLTYGDSRFGFEFDVERYNHFYKDANVAHLVENNCGVGPAGSPCTDLNTDALGYSAGVFAPFRLSASWRAYGVAGAGVIHSWLTDPSNTVADTNQDNVAVHFGGGVTYSMSDRVGVRGDVRYLRAFVDESAGDGFYFEDYGFMRATVGVTFRFGR